MDGRVLALGVGALSLLAGMKGSAGGSRATAPTEADSVYTARAKGIVAGVDKPGVPSQVDLRSKVRQGYAWMSTQAIVVPYFDMYFGNVGRNTGASKKADFESAPALSTAGVEAYSSFVLLPFLTLLTARRALMLGGPGRGKTTSAIILSLLSGMTSDQVRRTILRGHPQLMVSDILGQPLPSDLIAAKEIKDIKVKWREWIGNRVKIVDEYNRIPTKTQSALLSLMAEGQAEMFDQYVTTGRSSWFLTANDDQGGGTNQVIEALKDRIDIVVRSTPFNAVFAENIIRRVDSGARAEDAIPADVVLSSDELAAIYDDILKVAIPEDVVERIAFMMGMLEFCVEASPIFEYKSKDTLKLSGKSVSELCSGCHLAAIPENLCTQTHNSMSVRSLQAVVHYAKALAWFRGKAAVTIEDVRQILPWIMHDKLVPNVQSPQFEAGTANEKVLTDKVAWIGQLVDDATGKYFEGRDLAGWRASVKKVLADARKARWMSSDDAKAKMKEIEQVYNQIAPGDLTGKTYDLIASLRITYARYAQRVSGSANRRKAGK